MLFNQCINFQVLMKQYFKYQGVKNFSRWLASTQDDFETVYKEKFLQIFIICSLDIIKVTSIQKMKLTSHAPHLDARWLYVKLSPPPHKSPHVDMRWTRGEYEVDMRWMWGDFGVCMLSCSLHHTKSPHVVILTSHPPHMCPSMQK